MSFWSDWKHFSILGSINIFFINTFWFRNFQNIVLIHLMNLFLENNTKAKCYLKMKYEKKESRDPVVESFVDRWTSASSSKLCWQIISKSFTLSKKTTPPFSRKNSFICISLYAYYVFKSCCKISLVDFYAFISNSFLSSLYSWIIIGPYKLERPWDLHKCWYVRWKNTQTKKRGGFPFYYKNKT